jgi:hypothetical protein
VGYQIPSSTPFQIRGVLRYIIEKVTSASILSSSTWKYLGFPKLVSVVHKLLTFHKVLHGSPGLPHDMILRTSINEYGLSSFPILSKSEKIVE